MFWRIVLEHVKISDDALTLWGHIIYFVFDKIWQNMLICSGDQSGFRITQEVDQEMSIN